MPKTSIKKIVSGGQTGADQAGLDFAIEHGIPHGGWIPKGRLTEAGPLPDIYQLQEMPTKSYPKRTAQNVIDSDGTLIVSRGPMTGGTLLTWDLAKKHGKPCLHVDFSVQTFDDAARLLRDWVEVNGVEILNVAGPRASKDSSIYEMAKGLLAMHMGF